MSEIRLPIRRADSGPVFLRRERTEPVRSVVSRVLLGLAEEILELRELPDVRFMTLERCSRISSAKARSWKGF